MKQGMLLLVTALVSAFAAVGVYRIFTPVRTVIIHETPQVQWAGWQEDPEWGTQSNANNYMPSDFVVTAEQVTPCVVNIKSRQPSQNRFFNLDAARSTGSGVIISSNGYIVTNYHVIENGDLIEVTLHDKREYVAKVIGYDRTTDIALLRIPAEDLQYVKFANSDEIKVGEWVVAVGNPFNLESTVTAGIVSAKGRSINILDDAYRIESFIQTDAVINPGNSGGALVNTRSGLVGINTAIVTKSGKYEGYSFAIPSNLVLKVVRDIREFGTVRRGILGVNVDNLNQEAARSAGLNPGEGVVITFVNPSGAAFEAGIRNGDIIYSINQQRVQTVPQLQEQIGRYRPGQKLSVLYFREGLPFETSVTLKELESEQLAASPDLIHIMRETGLELRDLRQDEVRVFGNGGGVVHSVIKNSPADKVNIESGFIIRKINDKRVRDLSMTLELLLANERVQLEGVYKDFPGEYKYIFRR